MTWLVILGLSQSFAAKTENPGLQIPGLPPGIICNASQDQCCLLKISVERCKAAAISEGKTPEMTAEE